MPNDRPLLLVDGSSYLFRAFYALPDLRTSDGIPTGAIRGVIAMLRRLAQDYEGSPIAVVFDAKGKTFRDDMFSEYKANRDAMPDDLVPQIQPIHDIIRAMGLPLLVVDGVEADDVIGTLAAEATRTRRRTVVSTSDKDMAQLVSEHVTLIDTMKEEMLDSSAVESKFGVPPERIIDYLALMGDKVDNIPGIPGVGPKTAAKWLNTYGSLDQVVENAASIKGKIGERLREHLDQLDLSRQLATIKCDVDLEVSIDGLEPTEENRSALVELYEKYEFRSFLSEMGVSGAVDDSLTAVYATTTDLKQLETLVHSAIDRKQVSLEVVTAGGYMDSHIVGIAICSQPGNANYIPIAHANYDAEVQPSLVDVLRILRPLLEDETVAKVGSNIKALQHTFAVQDIELAGDIQDTMLESFLLKSSASGHDTAAIARREFGVSTIELNQVIGERKNRIPLHEADVDKLGEYAAERAHLNLRVHDQLWDKLGKIDPLQSIFREIDAPLSGSLMRMERNGTLLDIDHLQETTEEFDRRIDEIEERVFDFAGERFSLRSTSQLAVVLYDKLKLPAPRPTKTGHRSTKESVLQRLALLHDVPKLILDHRHLSTLRSTYLYSLPHQIHPRTRRLHTTYHLTGASSSRVASSGPNLQNIPHRTADGRKIRQAFVAADGFKIMAADYSQIELRVMAHAADDAGLQSAFASGSDIHRVTASEIFYTPLDDVTDEQRQRAKAINFGLIYGMSSFGLAQRLDIDQKTATEYRDTYFERYPNVREYMDRTVEHAHEHEYVVTPLGRRLYVNEINSRRHTSRQAAERTAINAPIQGGAADIIKKATIEVDRWIRESGSEARMIMQVHDELVLEVPETEVDETASKVRQLMADVVEVSVPLVVDVGVGDNWDETD